MALPVPNKISLALKEVWQLPNLFHWQTPVPQGARYLLKVFLFLQSEASLKRILSKSIGFYQNVYSEC